MVSGFDEGLDLEGFWQHVHGSARLPSVCPKPGFAALAEEEQGAKQCGLNEAPDAQWAEGQAAEQAALAVRAKADWEAEQRELEEAAEARGMPPCRRPSPRRLRRSMSLSSSRSRRQPAKGRGARRRAVSLRRGGRDRAGG